MDRSSQMLRLQVHGALALTGLLVGCHYLCAQQAATPELEKHLRQAQIDLDQARYPDAVRDLRAAIAIAPKIPGANYQLGFASFQLGQLVEAERAFIKELEFQPPDPYSLYYLGRIRLDAGRRHDAVA